MSVSPTLFEPRRVRISVSSALVRQVIACFPLPASPPPTPQRGRVPHALWYIVKWTGAQAAGAGPAGVYTHESLLEVVTSPALLPNVLAVLLEVAKHERDRPVRLACFIALETVVVALGGVGTLSSIAAASNRRLRSYSETCPWRLVQLFPGTLAALCDVIHADFKQGSKVFAAAADCLRVVLVRCVADRVLEAEGVLSPADRDVADLLQRLTALGTSATSDADSSLNMDAVPSPPLQSLPAHSTGFVWDESWLTMCRQLAAPRLVTAVECVSTHSHPRVRRAAVDLATTVALHCSRCLPSATLPAVEALLALANDDVAEVRAAGDDSVRDVLAALRGDALGARYLMSALRPRFWASLAALPR